MLRIGIVGCGRILAAHLRGYRLLRAAGVDNFRITALCARKEDDARMYVRRGAGPPQRPAVSAIAGDPLAIGDEYLSDFQPETNVEVFTDYRAMIEHGAIDAVNDFTTHALHHQVAQAALERDLHLLTQKPLAITVRAAQQMCELAERRQRVFGVFENFRFSSQTRHLKWFFDDVAPQGGGATRTGLGGRLQMVLVGYVGAWWAPNRIVADTPWRHLKQEAGGISLDLGVHFFDQIRHLAGEIRHVTATTAIVEPRRVMLDAAGRVSNTIDCDADDTCYAAFDTVHGVTGTIVCSWAGHGAPTLLGEGTVFYGTKARVTGDTVTFDDGSTASLAALYRAQAPAERQAREFPHGLTDDFALAQLDWLSAIAERRQPQTDGREGLADLAAAYAILESSDVNRRIAVEQVRNGLVRDYQRPLDRAFGLDG